MFKKGCKHSEEHRRKISESLKGKKQPWTTKRNLENNPMKNPATRKKVSEKNKGNIPWQKKLGDNHPKVINYKKKVKEIGAQNKGKKPWNYGLTKKDPRVMKYALSLKGNKFGDKNKGKKSPWTSKRNLKDNPMWREEIRIKVGLINKGKFSLEKNPMWKGGLSFEPYSIEWSSFLRKTIRERDHYTCKICSGKGKSVHHIDYNKKNCNSENLITLCKSCHSKTNINRKKWVKFFNEKLIYSENKTQ